MRWRLNPDSPSAARADEVKQGRNHRMATEAVPTVAPRNDPNPLEPYAKSEATKIAGERPGFTYHWFRPEQLATNTSKHEIGNKHTGYLMVDGWEVVPRAEVKIPGRGMASAGKPMD